tara:strand:+ start:41 stop:397 length:357 start_codon:yes stop_codon:yes gene_type:complete
MKFKLGNTNQFVEVEIIYSVREAQYIDEYFICTEDLLNEYDITVSKFVKFLKQDLEYHDPDYKAAFELWSSNRPLSSKNSLKNTPNFQLDKVSKIITADEETIIDEDLLNKNHEGDTR